jgi:hypothetical protein
MGRHSTGIVTTGQSKRIELSYLLKKGYIKKNCCVSGSLSWTDESSIGFYSVYTEDEAYIELNYTITDYSTNEKTSYNYKAFLDVIPSNLGKGEILYFICPDSGKKCRILYKCYGSGIWKARESYQNRIYYESQIESKRYRGMKGLFLDRQISDLYQNAKKSHYKGKPTRLIQRINKLKQKENIAYRDYNSIEKLMNGIK